MHYIVNVAKSNTDSNFSSNGDISKKNYEVDFTQGEQLHANLNRHGIHDANYTGSIAKPNIYKAKSIQTAKKVEFNCTKTKVEKIKL